MNNELKFKKPELSDDAAKYYISRIEEMINESSGKKIDDWNFQNILTKIRRLNQNIDIAVCDSIAKGYVMAYLNDYKREVIVRYSNNDRQETQKRKNSIDVLLENANKELKRKRPAYKLIGSFLHNSMQEIKKLPKNEQEDYYSKWNRVHGTYKPRAEDHFKKLNQRIYEKYASEISKIMKSMPTRSTFALKGELNSLKADLDSSKLKPEMKEMLYSKIKDVSELVNLKSKRRESGARRRDRIQDKRGRTDMTKKKENQGIDIHQFEKNRFNIIKKEDK